MRNTLRRIAFGVLSTGMIATMAIGASAGAASAAVSVPRAAAVAELPPPALIWPVVRKGDHGLRVVKVQLLLIQHGIPVKVDGKFGRMTELGVKIFQKKHRIFPSGIVGARTWEKLIVFLRKGSRGPAVTAVQIELKFMYGFKYLTVDGVYGHMTEKAVRLFQKRYHLFPDGKVGPSTWHALVWYDRK
jgi:peptidoglycan hydrolase-like protein with peptidoglycan-binding domain